jgi:hypothetical protein
MAKVSITANDSSALWAASGLDQVLSCTLTARYPHVLVLDQLLEVWIALVGVDLVGMLHAKGHDCLQGQARSGLGFSPFLLLISRLAKKTLSKPQTYGSVAYPQQFGYTVKIMFFWTPHFGRSAATREHLAHRFLAPSQLSSYSSEGLFSGVPKQIAMLLTRPRPNRP